MTKTEEAISLFKQGRYKEALRIFKSFRHGLTQEQVSILTIAYEGYSESGARFYAQIGKDITSYQQEAKDLIRKKYII